ncbi:MAG: hypothetical protein D6688_07105 [Alphaproteobacteria bacterium]|nr:MAG: hypothetical protein D6688_07105 [Alphaproteobacteria bacterium]
MKLDRVRAEIDALMRDVAGHPEHLARARRLALEKLREAEEEARREAGAAAPAGTLGWTEEAGDPAPELEMLEALWENVPV